MNNTYLDRLETKLAAGAIDRRQFIMSALAAGAPVSGAVGWADKVAAATPKAGGTLRIGVAGGNTTDSLDPATYKTEMSSTVANAMCNYLMEISPSGELVNELAESYEASPDAKTWTFKLRKGIEFHNGKTLDADDVITSLQHHLGEESKSAAKSSVAQIEEFQKDDSDTIIFKLKSGNADFPYVFTDYHIPIMPAKDGKLDWNAGVGTGGYTLAEYEPGVRALLKKNPNYWKEGRAHVDEAELTTILDTTARQNALINGSVDAIEAVDIKTAHLLARNQELRLLEVTGRLHHSWPMRVESAPFDNNDFRLAIKHAVDRQELLDKIFMGHGALGNDNPISPVYEYYADFPQREPDLDKAKHHLQKSGVGNMAIDLSSSDGAYNGALDAAVLIKDQLAKAGINVNVVREAADGYWSNTWRKKPWCAVYWTGRPTIDWMLSSGYAAASAYTDSGWQTDRFNSLLVQARAELDRTKRAEMYREMQGIIRDDAATLITTFGNYVMALRNNVQHGEKVSGSWGLDGGRAVERWWLDS